MNNENTDSKLLLIVLLALLLSILVFLAIKAVILSVIAGLILAYIFFPLYSWFLKKSKSKNLSASLVLIITLLIVLIPIWIIAPIAVDQIFEIFRFSQSFDVQTFIQDITQMFFPTASEQFLTQVTISIGGVVSQAASIALNSLVSLFLDIPKILLHTFIIFFVYFYTLRDADKLKEFVKDLSPFEKTHEKRIIQEFKDITNSIVYGQIIVGIVQGILAGIGLWIFGIPNAFVFALLAVLLAIIPIVGPALVWIPATIYLFIIGNPVAATLFLIYNLIIVSTVDNLLRTHIVSKKTKLSPVIVLVGMIGGLFIFGILGLIIGPLILSYLIIFLNIYKEKKLKTIFRKK